MKMKKFIGALLSVTIIFLTTLTTTANAAETPVYDATFNNNKGAFYANGTAITINKNSNGETVISWSGGSQVVPETVYVFGGGYGETSYATSNITMNDGTVSFLIGGGISLDENKNANVTNATTTVNGGTVLIGVIGGGFVYSTVQATNITINNGTVAAVGGGRIC